MDILLEVLMHSLLLILWGGSVIGAIVGAGMLFVPTHTFRINEYFSRWVDTTAIAAELDRPRWSERFFYRHHRWTGAGLMLGGAFVLYQYLLAHVMRKVIVFLKGDVYGVVDALSAVVVIGAVLALFIGLILFGRPSLLREVEAAANQWISTERMLLKFNGMNFSFDRYAVVHRKAVGTFLLLGGIYAACLLGKLLLRSDWLILLGS